MSISTTEAPQIAAISTDPKLCYSTNEEDFIHDSPEDAIDELACSISINELAGKPYWVGEAVKRPGSYFFRGVVQRLLEHADEVAYDEAGEHSEGFGSDITDSASDELEALVKDWADRNVPVNFYSVVNVRRLEVTAEDVAAIPRAGTE